MRGQKYVYKYLCTHTTVHTYTAYTCQEGNRHPSVFSRRDIFNHQWGLPLRMLPIKAVRRTMVVVFLSEASCSFRRSSLDVRKSPYAFCSNLFVIVQYSRCCCVLDTCNLIIPPSVFASQRHNVLRPLLGSRGVPEGPDVHPFVEAHGASLFQ